MWTVAGTMASKAARRAARRALHGPAGDRRLPRRVRRSAGWGTALAWAIGAGVVLGLADVLAEQGKDSAAG